MLEEAAHAFWQFRAIGAKVRADLVIVHTVPQSDAKKWRNSVPIVPVTSVCCTCVPGVLPLLRKRATNPLNHRKNTVPTVGFKTCDVLCEMLTICRAGPVHAA